jgi:hypothetical protein
MLAMKQQSSQASWLKGYHWEDLANLQVELGFLRHRLILTINQKFSQHQLQSIETLDRLAQVDELLAGAGETLEKAKAILFNICYESSPSTTRNGKAK